MIQVGLIGLGAIGRVHYGCWRQSTKARLVAVSARDPKKLAGDWRGQDFNIGAQAQENVDLSDLATYPRAEDLIADPRVELVDICTTTPLHAPLAIAALRAGKHVLCEKPMALSLAECRAMEEEALAAGKFLMIGHCLRFWPQYVRAHELLTSGEFGRPIYASLHRSSAAPSWSGSGWFMQKEQSGGVLDLHIHDIDVALWWFGRPQKITSSGYAPDGLPLIIDAAWHYADGPAVHLHGSWDRNGGSFNHGFRLIMEKGTLVHDLATDPQALVLRQNGQATSVPVGAESGHQAELDYFATEAGAGRAPSRLTPADSRLAVELGLEELRQIGS